MVGFEHKQSSSISRIMMIELNTRDFFTQTGGKAGRRPLSRDKRQVNGSQVGSQVGSRFGSKSVSKLANIACEFAAAVATVLVMLAPVPFAVLIGLPVFGERDRRVLWRAFSSALAVEVTVVIFVLFCSMSHMQLGVAYFLLAFVASVLLLESMILKHSSRGQ